MKKKTTKKTKVTKIPNKTTVSTPVTTEPAKPQPEPFPQLTFTEAEHRSLQTYLGKLDTHATFNNMTRKQIHEFARNDIEVVQLIKKVENHIFEFKRKISSLPKGK